jgi:hypothetical protein
MIIIFINFLEFPYERYNLYKDKIKAIMKKAEDAVRILSGVYPVCMHASQVDKLKRNTARIANR